MTSFAQPWKITEPLWRTIFAVAGTVALRVRQLAKILQSRRDADLLARLDDRMLADIGLTRSDLRDAYAEPMWRDPTAILVTRAGERRAGRRRAMLGLPTRVVAPSLVPDPSCETPQRAAR